MPFGGASEKAPPIGQWSHGRTIDKVSWYAHVRHMSAYQEHDQITYANIRKRIFW